MLFSRSAQGLVLFVLVMGSGPLQGQQSDTEAWNRFRGPNGAGISTSSEVATSWSSGENIQWKAEIPGPGSSSPIVQEDRVFLTCYTGYGTDSRNPGDPADLKRHLLCFDRNNGKELWRATVDSQGDEDAYRGFITDHGYSSSTPTSDGNHVFAFFGKSGVIAWDIDGNQKWQVNVGTQSDPAKWGAGASLMLYKNTVIVNAGIEGHALIALNQTDGSEAWRIDNDKFTNNWSTPILVQVDGHDELIYSAPGQIIGINPDTGEKLWNAASPIKDAITASVVAHEGVVYTLGGRQGQAIAIRCGGSGDVSDSHTVWQQRVTSSIGTPLVFGDHLYWLASGGIATCLKLADGSEVSKKRLEAPGSKQFPNSSYASPIIVGDKLVIVRRSGMTHILTANPDLEVISNNALEDDESMFSGTPAVAGNQVFIRSNTMLYCIAEQD